MAVPITRSPTDTPSTPSPTQATTPANSLPGTKGTGALSWYLFATSSTSGKLTAAAETRTRTCPGPSGGDGRSSTATASGGPYSRQTAARMSAVVRGLGQGGGVLEQLEHHRPER